MFFQFFMVLQCPGPQHQETIKIFSLLHIPGLRVSSRSNMGTFLNVSSKPHVLINLWLFWKILVCYGRFMIPREIAHSLLMIPNNTRSNILLMGLVRFLSEIFFASFLMSHPNSNLPPWFSHWFTPFYIVSIIFSSLRLLFLLINFVLRVCTRICRRAVCGFTAVATLCLANMRI